jgi:hypothetical protein
VTASTNKDNPKIDFAGVDPGVKMFVELKYEAEVWAKPTTAEDNNPNIRIAIRVSKFRGCFFKYTRLSSFTKKETAKAIFCLGFQQLAQAKKD